MLSVAGRTEAADTAANQVGNSRSQGEGTCEGCCDQGNQTDGEYDGDGPRENIPILQIRQEPQQWHKNHSTPATKYPVDQTGAATGNNHS